MKIGKSEVSVYIEEKPEYYDGPPSITISVKPSERDQVWNDFWDAVHALAKKEGND